MAVLTANQLAYLRRTLRRYYEQRDGSIPGSDFTKPDIDAAFQAIENWFEGERATISAAIDGAGAFSFTNDQKTMMGAAYLIAKSEREAGI